jgi:hypothetical protein
MQEEKTCRKDSLWSPTNDSSFTKQATRKEKGMTMASIKRVLLQLQSRLSGCLTLGILEVGVSFLTKSRHTQQKEDKPKRPVS